MLVVFDGEGTGGGGGTDAAPFGASGGGPDGAVARAAPTSAGGLASGAGVVPARAPGAEPVARERTAPPSAGSCLSLVATTGCTTST